MVTRERRQDRSRLRTNQLLRTIGEELRDGRLAAGLSQRTVGEAVGISHSEVSRIELARSSRAPLETLVSIATAVGLDLSVRAYPAGPPVRDAAQLALLARFRSMLPATLRWRTEVPVRLPRDLRAWDGLVIGGDWSIPVDAETRLRDFQALVRREALKCRDDGVDSMILLVAGTRHNRQVLRLAAADLSADFPVSGRKALESLAAGDRPTGSSVIIL